MDPAAMDDVLGQMSEEDLQQYISDHMPKPEHNLLSLCIEPTIKETWTHMLQPILAVCAILRLGHVLGLPVKVQQAMTIGLGCYLMQSRIDTSSMVLMVVVALVASFTLVQFNFGSAWNKFSLPICIGALITCQLCLPSLHFNKYRGSLMILCMKLCSMATVEWNSVDKATKQPIVGMLPMLAYLLDGSTILFGPWLSYESFMKFYTKEVGQTKIVLLLDSIVHIVKSVTACVICLFFLMVSTCFVTHFGEQVDEDSWSAAYLTALGYRTSHYFISFFSSACVLAAHENAEDTTIQSVVRPISVELPHSLVDVVSNWNVPMHRFLRAHVFKPNRHLGRLAAVMITYTISALLHGANFQLSAVLLSLGVYTYAEHVLRTKLAIRLDACVAPTSCEWSCELHKRTKLNPFVFLLNCTFTVIAIWHLTYLGMVFDDNSDNADTGYSTTHTMATWSRMYFSSHVVAGVTILLGLVI